MARDKTSRDPKAVQVGGRIATMREQKGYSQDDFAIKLGVTKGAVGQWEIGATTPRPSKFQAISEVLGVTVRWLLTGNEPEEKVRAQTQPEAEALDILRDIPPDQQAAALAILRAYRDGVTKK